jgi:hypothetical protein
MLNPVRSVEKINVLSFFLSFFLFFFISFFLLSFFLSSLCDVCAEPLDEVVMPQVNSLLEQLDQGKSVQEMVREEKRRVRKKLDRSTTKLKRLKILQGKKEVGRLSQSSV